MGEEDIRLALVHTGSPELEPASMKAADRVVRSGSDILFYGITFERN